MLDKFQSKLAELLGIPKENVEVFSVQLRKKHPPLTDVRFSAHGSAWYKPVKLNGLVLVSDPIFIPIYKIKFNLRV